jgi:hypothetical protein
MRKMVEIKKALKSVHQIIACMRNTLRMAASMVLYFLSLMALSSFAGNMITDKMQCLKSISKPYQIY